PVIMNQFSNRFRHLLWPLVSLALLLLFNAFFTDNFFKIEIKSADSSKKAVQTAVPESSARIAPENYEGASDSAEVVAEINEAAEEAVEQAQAAAQQPAPAASQQQESKGVSIFGYYLYGTPIDILNQGAKVMVLAIGMTLVIATGGIDISVGAVMAIAGAIAALLISMLDAGNFPGSSLGPNVYWIIPLAAALILATVAGIWNGMLVAGFGIQPMVATLVLMVAGRGVAQLITDGQIITFDNPALVFLCNGHALFLPFSIWIVATMYIVAGLLTRKTAFGLFIESVGNNERASRYAGIEARRIKWLAYVICGFCAGVAGLLAASNIKCADSNNAGLYLELDAILATVIGGTSMAGGRFFLSGSLVGAILIQTLTTTMYMKNVSPAIVQVPKAMVVIIVCLLQSPVFRAKVLSIFASKAAKGGVQ
ncbi:MAG: ABC transporter permease, partial [Clostridia bacterium]|nr:ABC transporter permease [Clostridia bacterium]